MKKVYKTLNVDALDNFLNDGWSLEQLSHPTAVVSRPEPKCPKCGRDKGDRMRRGDGHTVINIWCGHEFHKGAKDESEA